MSTSSAYIGADVSKVGEPQSVPVSENCKAWPAASETRSGLVAPKGVLPLRSGAGRSGLFCAGTMGRGQRVKEWQSDVLRHSKRRAVSGGIVRIGFIQKRLQLSRGGVGCDLFIPLASKVFLEPLRELVQLFCREGCDGGFKLLNVHKATIDQSACNGESAVRPGLPMLRNPFAFRVFVLVGWEGLEPSTNALKGRCSTIELPTHPSPRGDFRAVSEIEPFPGRLTRRWEGKRRDPCGKRAIRILARAQVGKRKSASLPKITDGRSSPTLRVPLYLGRSQMWRLPSDRLQSERRRG